MEHLLRRLSSTDVKHHAVRVGTIECTVVPSGRPWSHASNPLDCDRLVVPCKVCTWRVPPSECFVSVHAVWPRHCEQEATLLAGHDPAARAPRALSLPCKRRDSLCTPKQRQIRQTRVTSDVATRDVQLRVPCSQLLLCLLQLLLLVLQLLLLLNCMLLSRHRVLLCSLPVAIGLLQLGLCLQPQLKLLCSVPPEPLGLLSQLVSVPGRPLQLRVLCLQHTKMLGCWPWWRTLLRHLRPDLST